MLLIVLAGECLHVRSVCIWRCEHGMFGVEVFMHHIKKIIHSPSVQEKGRKNHGWLSLLLIRRVYMHVATESSPVPTSLTDSGVLAERWTPHAFLNC